MNAASHDTDENDAWGVDALFEPALEPIDPVCFEHGTLANDVGIAFNGHKERWFAEQ